jgi:Fe-S-cluster containining protein
MTLDPSRNCGTCTACCTAMAVQEIMKPNDTRCIYQITSNRGGCGIYDERPKSCQDFYCLWRHGFGRTMERPDRSGFVLDLTTNTEGQRAFVAHEAWPNAFTDNQVKDRISKLADKYPVILVKGDNRSLIGPAHLVDRIRKRVGL